MAKYRIDGLTVDTDRAKSAWVGVSDFDGRNYISRATGSQWDHEKLYLSARGRYYIESWSDRQGSRASARYVTAEEAAAWLDLCEHPIPSGIEYVGE